MKGIKRIFLKIEFRKKNLKHGRKSLTRIQWFKFSTSTCFFSLLVIFYLKNNKRREIFKLSFYIDKELKMIQIKGKLKLKN